MKKFLYLTLFCFACISCKMNYDQVTRNRDIESISVNTSGLKCKNYIVGDYFNSDGLIVKANFTDGSDSEISIKECTFNNDPFNETGNGVVIVSYKGFTTSFNVNVGDGEIEKIFVYSNPRKLYYITNANESFDSNGLIVKAIYKTGNTKTLDNNKLLHDFDSATINNNVKIVNIYLKENRNIYTYLKLHYGYTYPTVNVIKKPGKTTYLQNREELNFTGFIVQVDGQNHFDEDALEWVFIDPKEIISLPAQTNKEIKIYTTPKKPDPFSFKINITASKIEDLSIHQNSSVLFHEGEELDLISSFDIQNIRIENGKTNLEDIFNDELEKIQYTYNSSYRKFITSPIKFSGTGKQEITFYYDITNGSDIESKSQIAEIFVYEPKLKSITAEYKGSDFTFKEFLNYDNWTITGELSNGEKQSISASSCSFEYHDNPVKDFLNNGTLSNNPYTVKVSYNGFGTSQILFVLKEVTIKSPTQTGIVIKPINGSITIPNDVTDYSLYFNVYKTYDCGIDCTGSSFHKVSGYTVTKFHPDFGADSSEQGVIKVTSDSFTAFHEATFTKTQAGGAQ